jgi:hypothetical protein
VDTLPPIHEIPTDRLEERRREIAEFLRELSSEARDGPVAKRLARMLRVTERELARRQRESGLDESDE